MRAGFDVPLQDGKVVDDSRIKDVLPTLKYLIEQKAKIVIISHVGRPEGWDHSKSLWPVAEKLGELINYKVAKVSDRLSKYPVPHINFLPEDITKKDYSALSKELAAGSILFLENVRFYRGEQDAHEGLAKTLATFGDVYVNEAFSVAHRKEASTFALAKLLPHYAGVSLIKEIQALKKVLHHPQQPLIVIMGGAKIEGKVETIENLAKHADHVLIGGAMINSFLAALGFETGKSAVADVKVAKQLLRNYKNKIVLPQDVVVANSEEGHAQVVSIEKIRSYQMNYDIGPKTIHLFSGYIKNAKTLLWNGPLGKIEQKKFSTGSMAIAQVFASRSKGKAFGIVGGGETVEVVDRAKVSQFIDHVSTGGGAMLEFLAGKTLPAIKVLEK